MRTRPRATSSDLRLAIACLPRHTREAMLAGIAGNDIIVGAYATADGICPMLAAHRNGGRTDFISFARAWDRFAFRSGRGRRTRRATERELRVLRVHLEASLLEDDAPLTDLAAARREHDALVQGRHRDRASRRARAVTTQHQQTAGLRRGGEADRRPEQDDHPGWSWSRLVRRYDDYTRLLAQLGAESAGVDDPPQPAAPAPTREPAAAR